MNTDGDKINIEDVQNKLNDLKKYLESSLETKNNEYNILMDKKDEDINLIKNEFILFQCLDPASEEELENNGSSSSTAGAAGSSIGGVIALLAIIYSLLSLKVNISVISILFTSSTLA